MTCGEQAELCGKQAELFGKRRALGALRLQSERFAIKDCQDDCRVCEGSAEECSVHLRTAERHCEFHL